MLPVFGQGIVNNGGLLIVGNGANVFISGGGNYLNQSNGANHGSIDLDGSIYVTGNWTNNASSGNVFVNIEGSPNGTLHLTGTSQQSIAGSASTYFENLTINNSTAGNAVLLSTTQNIKGTLTFTDGIIGTGANKVIVENTAVGSITGHASDKYINGNLRRFVSTGTCDLPIGTLANYELANTNITTLGSLAYLDAYFTAASPGAVTAGLKVNNTTITEMLDYGYWTITPDNGATSIMDITVVLRGHSNGGTLADQHALFRRVSAGNWENFATHSNTTQSGTLTNPISAKRTASANIISYEYAIGKSDANTLPIELLYFNSICGQDSGVVVKWATSSESNNDYFTIFKSKDAISWQEIARVDGAGNSNSVREYSYIDKAAVEHDTYYRLRQTDYDGKYEDFKIVSVYCKYNHKKITIYPQPCTEYFDFTFYNEHHLEDQLTFRIFDVNGVIVGEYIARSEKDNNNHHIILEDRIISGNYFIQVLLGDTYFYSGKITVVKN